ncbi:MAG: alpha/beta hydrolase [Chloroflexota bacterium]
MLFAETSGARIAYEERGRGAGLPIVWLQGLGADHTAWGVQLAHFGATHRCLAPDNRDAGATTAPEAGDQAGTAYTVGEMAGDVVALLDTLGIARAHVVGLSMGASIAQELALGWADRVGGLVLASAFGRPHPRMHTLLRAWSAIYAAVDRETFYQQAAAWMFGDRYFANPRNIQALLGYVRRSPSPQPPAAFARQVEASLSHDTLDRLGEIRGPTLVIGGMDDILVPAARQQELAQGIPGARLQLIEHAGHSVNLETQAAFNGAVRSFLEEAGAS